MLTHLFHSGVLRISNIFFFKINSEIYFRSSKFTYQAMPNLTKHSTKLCPIGYFIAWNKRPESLLLIAIHSSCSGGWKWCKCWNKKNQIYIYINMYTLAYGTLQFVSGLSAITFEYAWIHSIFPKIYLLIFIWIPFVWDSICWLQFSFWNRNLFKIA